MSAWLAADWPAPPGVRALVTTRFGLGVSRPPFDRFNLGARCGDEPEAVAGNRRQLEAALGLPSAPCWLRQVHGTGVVRLGAPPPQPSPASGGGSGQWLHAPHTSPGQHSPHSPHSPHAPHAPDGSPPPAAAGGGREGGASEPEADAAVTSVPGTVLAILTADCLPVVLAARDGGEVAAAHAGWRGLAQGVLEATVAAMRTPPGALAAWLGPAAGPRAYEVGVEVFEAFVAADPGVARAFAATRPGHWHVDLYALARMRLVAAGLDPARIHGGGLCTISEPARFYSHRRDQRTGRMATLAWLEP